MKKQYMITALITLLTLTGCGQPTGLSQGKPTTNTQQHQTVQGGIGGNVDDGKYPVAPDHKNNSKFKENLFAKKANPFPGENATAQDIWQWTNDLELKYEYAMYFQQSSFTEEQKQALSEWLSQYYGAEVKDRRLQALEPVEGGYRIIDITKVYDYSAKKEFIESIDSLNLSTNDKKNMVLTAKLTVDRNQPVEVEYSYGKEDGKWKVVGYNFKLLTK